MGIKSILVALLLGFVGAPACKQPERPAVGEGEPAPAFEAKTLAGEPVELDDLRGKVVLVNAWATWCEPCVAELPELRKLHLELEDRGFTVIGLNADVERKRGEVVRMAEQHELPYPIWMDPESRAQVAFKLRGYPTSVLIDREGRIRWRREGVIVPNDPELMPVLEQLLAE